MALFNTFLSLPGRVNGKLVSGPWETQFRTGHWHGIHHRSKLPGESDVAVEIFVILQQLGPNKW